MRKLRPKSKTTVLLVDDHAAARATYQRILAHDTRLKIVADTAVCTDLHSPGEQLEADVIVLDISSPGMEGIETLRRVLSSHPAVRVLMLSPYTDALYASRAFEAGAHGYITKTSPPELLLPAVRSVANGIHYVSPDVERVMAGSTAKTHDLAMALSSREHEILRLLTHGYNLNEIGKHLGVTAKTVANHQSSIKQKLGAGSALQLILIARRLGLTQIPG